MRPVPNEGHSNAAHWHAKWKAAEAKLALAEQDARRYRWLRENALSVCWQSGRWNSGWTDYHPASSEHFDTAIDAAIAAGEGES